MIQKPNLDCYSPKSFSYFSNITCPWEGAWWKSRTLEFCLVWNLLLQGAFAFHKHILFIIANSYGTYIYDRKILHMSFSKFTLGSSVFHNSMRNKQVEFNPYVYTLSKLSHFGYGISVHSTTSVIRKLSHFQLLLWNRWTEFNETWQDARSQRPLPSLCFSGWSEKQDGRPSLWLAETFLTSSLKPMNKIQRNLTGSKISTSSTKFVFFGPVGKKRWPLWPLIGWDILDFFSETAERNSTKLDRKQDLNVFYQVCVIGANRKNKMAALASDRLRHFRLLWNCWMEFNKIWQEANS